MYVYISSSVSVWLSGPHYLSVCLSLCVAVYQSICLSIYLSIYLSVHVCIHHFIYLCLTLTLTLTIPSPLYDSLCPLISYFMDLSINLSIYLWQSLSLSLSLCACVCTCACVATGFSLCAFFRQMAPATRCSLCCRQAPGLIISTWPPAYILRFIYRQSEASLWLTHGLYIESTLTHVSFCDTCVILWHKPMCNWEVSMWAVEQSLYWAIIDNAAF